VRSEFAAMDLAYLFWLHLSLRAIVGWLDRLIEALTTYSIVRGGKREREEAERNFAKSAQMVKIWFKGTYTPLAKQVRRRDSCHSKLQ